MWPVRHRRAPTSHQQHNSPDGPVSRDVIQERWQQFRSEARSSRLSDGHEMVTSFTSNQPMHGWTSQHAIRELWQNLRDGLASTFGGSELEVTHASDNRVVVWSLLGDEIGCVDMSQRGRLVFVQKHMVLQPKHLQLASNKDDVRFAGCHGEGFKVAINFLLRCGCTVQYIMDGQTWVFEHKPHYDQTVWNMVVRMMHSGDRDDMEIVVTGDKAHQLFEAQMDWNLTWSKVDRSTGQHSSTINRSQIISLPNQELVILEGPSAVNAGRVYNRKLFVDVSDELRELALAVNLDVGQHRDRHVLPADMDRKVADAVQQAMSVHGSTSPTVETLCTHLLDRFRASAPQKVVRYAAALREVLREYCAQKHDIDDPKNIIFLAGEDADKLQDLGFLVVPDSGALADNLDVRAVMLQHAKKSSDYTLTTEETRHRLAWLQKLADALTLNLHLGQATLCAKALQHSSYCDVEFHGRSPTIYISSALLASDGGWRQAAVQMYYVLMRRMQQPGDALYAGILADFLRDPRSFTPKAVARPPHNHTGTFGLAAGNVASGSDSRREARGHTSGASGSRDGGGSGGGRQAYEESVPLPFSDIKFRNARPSIKPVHCQGPSTELPGCDSTFTDVDITCRVPKANLVPLALGTGDGPDITVFCDAEVFDFPEFQAAQERFCTQLPGFDAWVQRLKIRVELALNVKIELFYVVCHAVYGFCYNQGVYLNVWPIIGLNVDTSWQDAKESVLLTLLHELAHWTHHNHDTHFATELAKLIWACRQISLD